MLIGRVLFGVKFPTVGTRKTKAGAAVLSVACAPSGSSPGVAAVAAAARAVEAASASKCLGEVWEGAALDYCSECGHCIS